MTIQNVLIAHLEVQEAQADLLHATKHNDWRGICTARGRLQQATRAYNDAFDALTESDLQALAEELHET